MSSNFGLYEFIKNIVLNKRLTYFDLPINESLEKHMLFVKKIIIDSKGNDFFNEKKSLIEKLTKYTIIDIMNNTKINREIEENILKYNNYWNKIRVLTSAIDEIKIENLLVPLRTYQNAILNSMIILEKNREIIDEESQKTFITNAGFLTSQIGSGKTIMILALIITKPEVEDFGEWFKIQSGWVYQKSKKFINATVVFVNYPVFDQWKEEIRTKTKNMKVVYIHDVFSLRKIINNLNEVFTADIILVKNGFITSNWNNSNTRTHLMNAIGNIFEDYTFARIIIDDFDISTNNFGGMRASFYWYVASTSIKCKTSMKNEFEKFTYPKKISQDIIDLFSISATDEICESMQSIT